MSTRSFSTKEFFPALPQATRDRLEHVLARFEAAWQAGRRPALRDYLDEPDVRRMQVLLIELVHVDLHYRIQAGEPARLEDYFVRYPQLREGRRVVRDLILAEYLLRKERQPELPFAEYAQRFPEFHGDMIQALFGKPPASADGQSASPAATFVTVPPPRPGDQHR